MRVAVLMLAGLMCVAAPVLAVHAPPVEFVAPERTVQAIAADLTGVRFVDAVDRVQALLADPATQYVQVNERLIPIKAWIEGLLTDQAAKNGFVQQYSKSLNATAQRQLKEAVRSGSITDVLYVAELFPWTQAATDAPVEAARLATQKGDIATARALLNRNPATTNEKQWQALRDMPTDSVLPVMAFSASWYTEFTPWDFGRSLPVGSRDLVVFATPLSVVAMAGNGRVLWTTGKPPELKPLAPANGNNPQIDAPADQSLTRPIVWCDLSGTPRIVVARYTDTTRSTLRAYRVGDGSVLWDTAESESAKNLLMMGSPVASGGYVYFAATDFDAASGAHVVLGCVEITTGHLIFKTVVGQTLPDKVVQIRGTIRLTANEQVLLRLASSATDLSIDDYNIYAVFGTWCVAVDRFSGAARWFNNFPGKVMDPRVFDREKKSKKPPLYRRWRDKLWTNGTTAVVAPINSNSVHAYDSKTGKELWKNDSMPGDDILGIFKDRVVLAGALLTAIDPVTGATLWQKPLPDAIFTGPSIVEGDHVGLMTDRGMSYYSIDRGEAVQRRDANVLNFDAFLKQPPARTALSTVLGMDYFRNDKPTK